MAGLFPAWVPFIFFAFLYSVAFWVGHPAQYETALRFVCVDWGRPEHCTDKDATSEASYFNLINGLCMAIPQFLVAGTLGVLSDRFGRRIIMVGACLGYTIMSLGWVLCDVDIVGTWPRENWRAFIYVVTAISNFGGGTLMAVMVFFACVADITKREAEDRSWLFVLVECTMSLAGVAGTLASGFLMEVSSAAAFAVAGGCSFIAMVIALFFLEETTPKETMEKPIDWRQANSFASLMIALPLKSTDKLLREDHSETIAMIQSKLDEQNAQRAMGLVDPLSSPIVTTEPSTTGETLDAKLLSVQASVYGATRRSDEDDDYNGDGSTIGSNDMEMKNKDTDPNRDERPALEELVTMKPPGNTIYLLSASVLASVTAITPFRSILLLYLKQEFDMTDRAISYLLTLESFMRAMGPIVVIPLIIPRVKTRFGELKLMQFMLLCDAFFICLYGAWYSKVWMYLVTGMIGAFVTTPIGFLRSLMSTEVGPPLQAKVLSTIAAVEGLTSMAGVIMFNSIFSATTYSFPELCFYVMGLLFLISALIPLLRSDDIRTFNLRAFAFQLGKAEDAKRMAAEHLD